MGELDGGVSLQVFLHPSVPLRRETSGARQKAAIHPQIITRIAFQALAGLKPPAISWSQAGSLGCL